MRHKSSQVAVGGMASGLCLLFMFLTGIIPFSEYSCPAFAGLVLIAVAEELGRSTALIVYGAAALLSLLLAPSKESAILFIFFFGYYPTVRGALEEKLRPALLRWPVKLLLFNVMILLGYAVVVNLMGLTEIMDEFGGFGKYSALVLLAFGNVFFVIYDFMVGNLVDVYRGYFAPRFLRRKRK